MSGSVMCGELRYNLISYGLVRKLYLCGDVLRGMVSFGTVMYGKVL